jgi:hypothetical protein
VVRRKQSATAAQRARLLMGRAWPREPGQRDKRPNYEHCRHRRAG